VKTGLLNCTLVSTGKSVGICGEGSAIRIEVGPGGVQHGATDFVVTVSKETEILL
jgi:hypothetical protein